MRQYAHFQHVVRPEMEVRGPFEVNGRYWESLGQGLYEIRFGKGRIYCSVIGLRRLIMLYRAVIKRWPKFRPEDRRFCEQCKPDAESADYDQEKREYLYRNLCQRRTANGTP